MRLKEFLREHIAQRVNLPNFTVEVPKNPDHGDMATNAAFLLAKQNKTNPVELAKQLAAELTSDDFDAVAIGPFINFRFNDAFLVKHILSLDKNPVGDAGRNPRKVLLEFVSANPTGPLHIGHGRWAVMGDALARLMAIAGDEVTTEFYVNDAGNQVENLRKSVDAVRNNQPVPENGYHGAYVNDVAAQSVDPIEFLLDHQRQVLERLGVRFESWFREKTLHESGDVKRVGEYLDTYAQDGALWFRATAYGDDKDRVLIKATGDPTYFAADIAYHHHKLQRGANLLINIWGADHHGYVVRMQSALKTELERHRAELKIIIGQLVNLFRNKEPVRMSKRTGDMITLEEVMDEIGIDATRYLLVRYSPDTPIDFDLELAKKETMDNPVYYVQYAHARICSILRNNLNPHSPATTPQGENIVSPLLVPQERALAKKLLEFPDEIAEAALVCEPHRLATYAESLAATFHSFYHHCRVLGESPEVTQWRLSLVKATQTVLKTTLEKIFGITAPEKM